MQVEAQVVEGVRRDLVMNSIIIVMVISEISWSLLSGAIVDRVRGGARFGRITLHRVAATEILQSSEVELGFIQTLVRGTSPGQQVVGGREL